MWFLIACTCAMPAVQVVPSPVDKAPVNARIRLIAPSDPAGTTFELVKPDKKRPKKVEVDRTDLRSGALWFVELTPRQPLAPSTRYEIVMASSVIGEITTGEMPDQVPPTWRGVQKSQWQRSEARPGTCATGKPHVILCHQPDPDAALYAVWLAPENGKIDYGKPPQLWTRDWNGRLVLGPASICSPSNLELPDRGPLKVGIKAVDHAGNAGAPVEVSIPMGK